MGSNPSGAGICTRPNTTTARNTMPEKIQIPRFAWASGIRSNGFGKGSDMAWVTGYSWDQERFSLALIFSSFNSILMSPASLLTSAVLVPS